MFMCHLAGPLMCVCIFTTFINSRFSHFGLLCVYKLKYMSVILLHTFCKGTAFVTHYHSVSVLFLPLQCLQQYVRLAIMEGGGAPITCPDMACQKTGVLLDSEVCPVKN